MEKRQPCWAKGAPDSWPRGTERFARSRGVSIWPFEAAAGRGCPAVRGSLCRDIRPRQAIRPQQRCFCAIPERIGHAAARGPFIGQTEGARIFPPQGCRRTDSDSQQEDVERARTTSNQGRSEAALGRAAAIEGNRIGQTYATSPGEASLKTTP
jgi:hypothetical protein